MRTTALVPTGNFLPSIDDVEDVPFLPTALPSLSKNPLTAIAERNEGLAARLMDTLSARQNETNRSLAFLHANVGIARSHCATIAQAVVARPDKDHFKITTSAESGRAGFFFNYDSRYLKITTQLDMW
jgi:hypothetical protein